MKIFWARGPRTVAEFGNKPTKNRRETRKKSILGLLFSRSSLGGKSFEREGDDFEVLDGM